MLLKELRSNRRIRICENLHLLTTIIGIFLNNRITLRNMKKVFAFLSFAFVATVASANIILWNLPGLDDGGSGILSGNYEIAFLTGVEVDENGVVTSFTDASGANTDYLHDSDATYDWYTGTWKDSLATSGTVEYFATILSGGKYYTIKDSTDKTVTFTFDSSTISGSPIGDPSFGKLDMTDLGVEEIANSERWTVSYGAVPEPASALLALAGLACLCPRRKKNS